LVASARESLEEALINTNTSESHRKRIRRNLEELELIAISRKLERVRSVVIITEDSLEKGDPERVGQQG
jgi:hypothetical protein